MLKMEVIKLTPELAGELLKKNTLNRPLSEANIDVFVRAIKRGEWALNGEPIIIFENGDIGSGQHRCHAVIRSGIAIDTVMMSGVDSRTFGTLDTGKPRSSSDFLAIKGEVNTGRLAAAARAFLSCQITGRDAYCITNLQVGKCVEDHPHLRLWVQKYAGSTKAKSIIPASICGYLAIASEKYGFEKLDVFFHRLVTGFDLAQGDPALVLRERFLAQTKTARISASQQKAFMIKAINAHLLGKKLAILRLTENEQMPKII